MNLVRCDFFYLVGMVLALVCSPPSQYLSTKLSFVYMTFIKKMSATFFDF